MKTRGGDWVLAAIVGGSLLTMLILGALSVPQWRASPDAGQAAAAMPTSTAVGEALLGVRVDALGSQESASHNSLAGYLLPFEIISVHLLVVLIGAAYLARAKRRAAPREVEVA
jgi:NADH-quinone oxidoreductase subunit J